MNCYKSSYKFLYNVFTLPPFNQKKKNFFLDRTLIAYNKKFYLCQLFCGAAHKLFNKVT